MTEVAILVSIKTVFEHSARHSFAHLFPIVMTLEALRRREHLPVIKLILGNGLITFKRLISDFCICAYSNREEKSLGIIKLEKLWSDAEDIDISELLI